MSGVKGRSGRKTRGQEVMEGRFGHRMLEWLEKHFESLDEDKKIKVAMEFGLKVLPNKTEVKQEMHVALSRAENELIANQVRENLRLSKLGINGQSL